MSYANVLVAVDIGAKEARRLITSAIQIADPSRLTVAYVICLGLEHYARTDRMYSESLEEAYWCTHQHLKTLCAPLGLEGDQQRILTGNIVNELAHLVEAEAFDLVIIGRHEKTSPASTVQGVTARVPCDVLGVAIE